MTTQQAVWGADAKEEQAKAVRALDAALEKLPAILNNDKLTRAAKLAHCNRLVDGYLKVNKDRKPGFDKVLAVVEKQLGDGSLAATLQGQFYVKYAWDARSAKWAKDVTEEQWKLFAERLQKAEKALTRAWRLDPKNGDAAATMLTVELGQGKGRSTMEKWYRRAMRADPNNYTAASRKLYYLEPKWHGDEKSMLEFGRECLETRNWKGRLPFILIEAHLKLSHYPLAEKGKLAGYTRQPKPEYFQRPGVWKDVRAVYGAYLQLYPKAVPERSVYARLACWSGQWDEAHRQFKILGDSPRLVVFGGKQQYEKLRKEAEEKAGGTAVKDQ
jgi:hypothetical protein